MLYAWIDENGTLCTTYDLEFVPDKYKTTCKIFDELSISDADKLYVDNNEIKLKPEEMLKEEKILQIKNRLIEKVKSILNEKLSKYGYYSFGDLLFYAQAGEQEAIELLEWYRNFDEAVWNFLENEIFQKTLQELETFNDEEFLNGILQNLEFKI